MSNRQQKWTGSHSATTCLTHLLDMKNENINGFISGVNAGGRHRLTKWLGHSRIKKDPALQLNGSTHDQCCHHTTISLGKRQVWVIKWQVLVIIWQWAWFVVEQHIGDKCINCHGKWWREMNFHNNVAISQVWEASFQVCALWDVIRFSEKQGWF